jgi:hypothetical protein
MDSLSIIKLIKYIAVLAAALVIGSWFLAEAKKAKLNNLPWYRPYFSIPGLIILAALTLPIILFLI